jgi:hypothetical protein
MLRLSADITCIATLLAGRAMAADRAPDLLTDAFQATAASYFVQSAQTIQLNGESGAGDRVDWDQEFGGIDTRRIRLDGHWRFTDRQKVHMTMFGASHERTAVLEDAIAWGEETYPASARVETDFSFDIVEFAYEYAMLRRDNYELNGSVGLHYMTVTASLEADAESSGRTLTEDISETARLDAPLPVIGVGGVWSLRHDFWIDASAQFFALSIDDYNGHLQNYRASLTWQPRSWLGIGVGFNYFAIDLDADKDNFDGTLVWSYRGPLVFYRASF